MDRTELVRYLRARNIQIETWGKGEAKTFDHLLSELASGESVLRHVGGRLIKVGKGACINVYYLDKSNTFKLREEKQVFKDGRERVRQDLLAGVSEKMTPHEVPLEAAYRALREELGITERLPLQERQPVNKGPEPSVSFPGMYSQFDVHMFDLVLPGRWYKPEGYIEVQADKINYYVWDKIPAEEAPR